MKKRRQLCPETGMGLTRHSSTWSFPSGMMWPARELPPIATIRPELNSTACGTTLLDLGFLLWDLSGMTFSAFTHWTRTRICSLRVLAWGFEEEGCMTHFKPGQR